MGEQTAGTMEETRTDRPSGRAISLRGDDTETESRRTTTTAGDHLDQDVQARLLRTITAAQEELVARMPDDGVPYLGCYHLGAKATEAQIREDGLSPTTPTLSEQRAQANAVDTIEAEAELKQLQRYTLEQHRPDHDQFTTRHESVRFYPTPGAAKRQVKRTDSERCNYFIVGVTPDQLLDHSVVVADYAKLWALTTELVQRADSIEDYESFQAFLQSPTAAPIRTQATAYWESATVCQSWTALEQAVTAGTREWAELLYPDVVPPSRFDVKISVQTDDQT